MKVSPKAVLRLKLLEMIKDKTLTKPALDSSNLSKRKFAKGR